MARIQVVLLVLGLGACAGDDAAPDERCGVGDAAIQITGHASVDQYIRLDVAYSGGCFEHTFALQWSGFAYASDPPLLPLVLQHDGHGDGCAEAYQRSLWFDVSPFLALPVPAGTPARVSVATRDEPIYQLAYTFGTGEGAPPAADVSALAVCD